jgi:hypothetical protein
MNRFHPPQRTGSAEKRRLIEYGLCDMVCFRVRGTGKPIVSRKDAKVNYI